MIIGINLCPAPQISEHCPIIIPGRFEISIVWFIRPGVASAFTPIDGIVHECSTSFEVTITRVGHMIGITRLLETVLSRIFFEFDIMDVTILFIRFEYSYVQFHWYPIAFIVMRGDTISSIMYSVFIDGKAIKIRRKAGIDVQNTSV